MLPASHQRRCVAVVGAGALDKRGVIVFLSAQEVPWSWCTRTMYGTERSRLSCLTGLSRSTFSTARQCRSTSTTKDREGQGGLFLRSKGYRPIRQVADGIRQMVAFHTRADDRFAALVEQDERTQLLRRLPEG
jgi:hypothetical protein